MGQCLIKTAHSCGTRNGLQVYEQEDGSLDGYCWSCNHYVANPLGVGKTIHDIPKAHRLTKSREEIQEELAEIGECGTVDLVDRRLRAGPLEYYGIKVGYDQVDGTTLKFLYFPYEEDDELKAYKVKLIEGKRFWSVGDQSTVDLFGWKQAKAMGARRLIITEGELDAVALKVIFDGYEKAEFKDTIPAICSLPHGAASAHKDLARLAPKINRHFKQVSFCFDNDDAGRKATEECCKIFPGATSIELPCKDANDCILQGKGKAAYKAAKWNDEVPKNTRLVFGEELHEAAREVAKYGELTWPWEHINKRTRGIRYGETIYIGAGVKMGKSELLNELGAHFIAKHGVKIFMAKPEEANKKTYKLMAGKIVGKVFHDPDREFDFDAYDQAGEVLRGKLTMVNLYQHLGWESLKADIYAAAGWGAKVIFIDPITNLTNGMEAAAANIKLQEIAQELAAMALDLNIVVFIFVHLKAPEGNISKDARLKMYENGRYIGLGNCPHELGGDVSSNQFAGSRAMMRSCNYMLALKGNKDALLHDGVRNMRELELLEDREFGEVGNFPLYWNKNDTHFHERE
jgi:twinkle protein